MTPELHHNPRAQPHDSSGSPVSSTHRDPRRLPSTAAPASSSASSPTSRATSATRRFQGNRWLVLIGVGKLLKAVLFVALGFGALRLVHKDLVAVVSQWILDLRFDPESRFVNLILDKVSLISPHRMRLISYGIFLYAAVDTLEGTGLILGKAWAEYLTLILTASLLPWELYELIHKPNWPKVAFALANAAVVWYLAVYLRRRHHERHHECSPEAAPSTTLPS
jgi:uncharacterized membrane protein (DUF2068 family)